MPYRIFTQYVNWWWLVPLFIWSLVAVAANSAPPDLGLPPEVAVQGRYYKYAPPGGVRSIAYVDGDPADDVEPFPVAIVGGDPKVFFLDTKGVPEGRYRFTAVASDDKGELAVAEFAVVIGKPEPGPNPGPEPEPEPEPTGFEADLAEAYAKEVGVKRAEQLASLAELYRKAEGWASGREYATTGELFVAMAKEASRLKVAGELARVQEVIRVELNSRLPTDPKSSYDPALTSAVFGKMAGALEKLK